MNKNMRTTKLKVKKTAKTNKYKVNAQNEITAARQSQQNMKITIHGQVGKTIWKKLIDRVDGIY